jgi:hypothetical protein
MLRATLNVEVTQSYDAARPRTSLRALGPHTTLALVLLALAIAPLSLRGLNRLLLREIPPPGYLPSLEIRRPRHPFNAAPIQQLRYGVPAWVFIGDSMLNTRVDPIFLGRISSRHDENVMFLSHAATGPAWWYLAFKNNLVASGVRPRVVFFFFRDTNLTDTFFRLEPHYGGGILDEVALEHEPELDAIIEARRRGLWHRAHGFLKRAYQLDVAGMWMGPLVRRWYPEWRFPDPAARVAFEASAEETFGLDHLRHEVASDAGLAEAPDFHRDLPASVLPLIVDLARQHDLKLCFVRVQRRPEGGHPPEESPELETYVSNLRMWIEASGALFHDDTGDPEMTLEMYRDGDHVADRRRYTEIFRRRLDPLFR